MKRVRRIQGGVFFLSVFCSLLGIFGGSSYAHALCKVPLEELNLGGLQSWLMSQAQHLSKAEDVLECLPLDYRQRFVLIFESKAAQSRCVDPLNPRVIFFREDSEMILGVVAARPEIQGCESPALEIIQPQAEGFFDFRALDFPKGRPAQLSSQNPVRCSSCHGLDPRPLWNPSFTWPGVYGAVDDLIAPKSLEGQNYTSFVEKIPSHSLYSLLGKNSFPSRSSSLSSDPAAITPFTRPNHSFSLMMRRLQAAPLMRKMETELDLPRWRASLPVLLRTPDSLQNSLLIESYLSALRRGLPQEFVQSEAFPDLGAPRDWKSLEDSYFALGKAPGRSFFKDEHLGISMIRVGAQLRMIEKSLHRDFWSSFTSVDLPRNLEILRHPAQAYSDPTILSLRVLMGIFEFERRDFFELSSSDELHLFEQRDLGPMGLVRERWGKD